MRLLKGSPRDQQFLRGFIGQDWLYPAPRNASPNASAETNGANIHGVELAMLSNELGAPAAVFFHGVRALTFGITSAFVNEDNGSNIGLAASLNIGKLPADIVLEEHRRIHWWSWRQRLDGAPGTAQLNCGVHLRGNQLGTGWWGANVFPTIGHGIGLSLDGAGAWQFVRKISAATNAGASEILAVGALPNWNEIWFVILGATATQQAKFRLYINHALRLERAWPDDGITGSANPILEGGATSFVWTARCLGLTHAGLRLLITGWRYRQGFYDVDGSELTGL